MKDGLQNESSRALAISPGNSCDRNFPGGMLVEVCAYNRQGSSATRHFRPCYVWRGAVRIGDYRYRTGCNRLLDEAVAITRFAFHGDKNVSRFHLARVVFDTGDLRVPAARENLHSVQEIEESHWFRLYCKAKQLRGSEPRSTRINGMKLRVPFQHAAVALPWHSGA